MSTFITSGTKEIDFEDTVFNFLANSAQYVANGAEGFNFEYNAHLSELESYLTETQPTEWKKLQKQFPSSTIEHLATEIGKLRPKRSNISIWRDELVLQGAKFKLAYFKPATAKNPDHEAKFKANRLRVIRQFNYNPDNKQSIDIVILLNGLPLLSMELKNEFTGQNVQDAILQYRKDRDAKNRFLKSCLVHFALDNRSVFMCTVLNNGKSYFLPFNRDTHNPAIPGKFASSYLWEEILQVETMLNLIQNYYQMVKDKNTGNYFPIFPRYHQLDVVRKLLAHAKLHGPGQNYLVQHSAGSGKSNSIAWLAHQLATLHNAADEHIFDSVLVITDRRILDSQLQDNVKAFEKTAGVVKVIDKNAKQLIAALEAGERIIISTLQKFGFLDDLGQIKGKNFAIIVDEAHSSQTGENVKELKLALTNEETLKAMIKEDDDNFDEKDELTQKLEMIMKGRQKMPHISFFAFTATPKPKTLQLFGTPNANGNNYTAFHNYTMRQAIEEGFILDVLKNYTTYEAYFELIENSKAVPGKEFEKEKAKRLLLQQVGKHPYAIDNKCYIILDHFINKSKPRIDGQARGMIVTGSRAHAVLYKQAIDRIITQENYPLKALVAFSGTVEIEGIEYTEEGMNKPVTDIPEYLRREPYRLLIVANKFQTGFDEPLLHSMYVDKRLGGVATVQTLSRLNRCAKNKTDTLVLDFVNSFDDIQLGFQDYYQNTSLGEPTDTQKLYNLKYEIEKAQLFSPAEVGTFADLFIIKKAKSEKLSPLFTEIANSRYTQLEQDAKELFRGNINKFIRQYTFLSQLITFVDAELEEFYLFVKLLFKYLPYEAQTLPLEVVEMVDMDKFRIQESSNGSILLNPENASLDNPGSDGHKSSSPQTADLLETIIKELNQNFAIDLDESHKITTSIKEKLVKNQSLLQSFKANNVDQLKRMRLNEAIEEALMENADDYLNFMAKMESNPSMKKTLADTMFKVIVDMVKE